MSVNFKIGSKPTLSREEYKDTVDSAKEGKYIREPGTYEMSVKTAEYAQQNQNDPAWMSAKFELEDGRGKLFTHYQDFPTECKNSYLFGKDKSVWPLENLQKFLRAFGVVFDYENGIQQMADIFGNLDKFALKTLRVRLGYSGNHIKKVRNEDDTENYRIVDRDGTPLFDESFADLDSAKAFAKDNNVKYQPYMKVLEFFPATENSLEAVKVDNVDYAGLF